MLAHVHQCIVKPEVKVGCLQSLPTLLFETAALLNPQFSNSARLADEQAPADPPPLHRKLGLLVLIGSPAFMLVLGI